MVPVLRRFECFLASNIDPQPIHSLAEEEDFFKERIADHGLFDELASILSDVINTDTDYSREYLERMSDRLKRLKDETNINYKPQIHLYAVAVFLYTSLNSPLQRHLREELFKNIHTLLLSYRQPHRPNDIYLSLWRSVFRIMAWADTTLRYENRHFNIEPVRKVIIYSLKALQEYTISDTAAQYTTQIETEMREIETIVQAIASAPPPALLQTIEDSLQLCRSKDVQFNYSTDQTAYCTLYADLSKIYLEAVEIIPSSNEEDEEEHMQTDNEEHTNEARLLNLHDNLALLFERFTYDGKPSMGLHGIALFLDAAINSPLPIGSKRRLLDKVDFQLKEHDPPSDDDDPFFELRTFTAEILSWGKRTLEEDEHHNILQVRDVLIKVLKALLRKMPSLVIYTCSEKVEGAIQPIEHATDRSLQLAIDVASTRCRDILSQYSDYD